MDYIIETNNLTKFYKNVAVVDGVNLHVKRGSIYGFVGENGSGKTTIMRLLMNLISPNEGTYSLFGIERKDKKIYEVRKDISAIVEAPSLVPSLTAKQNLMYACQYYGIKNPSEVIESSLKDVGLSDTGKKKVKNFSLGMRQRLGIALLLLNKPKLLLLDEPMNGLDPEGIAELRDLIIKLNHQGITFLISSHILSELEKVATDWGFISHGQLLQEMSADELSSMNQKSIEIKYSDVYKLKQSLEKLNITTYQELSNNVVRIFTDVNVRELLNKLYELDVDVTHVNVIDTSVEEYYLQLIRNGGR